MFSDIVVYMILSIRGFDGGLYRKLKVRAAIDGVTMVSIVMEAVGKHLGVMPSVVVVPPIVVTPSVGDLVVSSDSESTPSVSEITSPVTPKKRIREVEWAQGMCPKHGRMAINGKFTCC